MKKSRNLILKGITVLSFMMYVMLFSGCLSLFPKTVDHPGLSVDPENCAYITGSISAIDGYEFSPFMPSNKTIRVPTVVPQVKIKPKEVYASR